MRKAKSAKLSRRIRNIVVGLIFLLVTAFLVARFVLTGEGDVAVIGVVAIGAVIYFLMGIVKLAAFAMGGAVRKLHDIGDR
jgi:hypothetical protein